MATQEENDSNKSELIQSAISFLTDGSVKDAPLTKKIEFLQSKGLNQEEIEYAISESKKSSGVQQPVQEQHVQRTTKEPQSHEDSFLYETLPPPLPQRDWKDYFVMATVTAGLVYGFFEVTKRYVIPNILPESKSKLEQDKDEIKGQFDKIDQVLNAIEKEHNEFKEQEQKKLDELDSTIEQLEASLDDNRKGREKMDDDFRLLKLEMANLQGSLDKFVAGNNSVKELESINQELLSLKNLIKTSGIFTRDVQAINKVTGSPNSTRNLDINTNNDNEPPTVENGVPGIESIPTASELLAKFNKKDQTGTQYQEDTNSNDRLSTVNENVPAWKVARENNLKQGSSSEIIENNDMNGIPEWQRMLQEDSE